VLPRARAEERTLYCAARRAPGVSLLVQALVSEHQILAGLLDREPCLAGGQCAA
jgi:hypothetical protein